MPPLGWYPTCVDAFLQQHVRAFDGASEDENGECNGMSIATHSIIIRQLPAQVLYLVEPRTLQCYSSCGGHVYYSPYSRWTTSLPSFNTSQQLTLASPHSFIV